MGTTISGIAGRTAAKIQLLARDSRNALPAGIILFLLALLSARSLIDELSYEIGLKHWSMFVAPEERFGDLLKAAMTYITRAMVDDAHFARWPDQFKAYLIYNENTGPLRYNLHLLPVANLLLMSGAKLILALGPTKTYLVFLVAYLACTTLIARFFAKSMAVSKLDAFAFAFVLFGSYPALFMLTRGNFNSGFTSLLLCSYVLTALSGKARWLGWIAFAVALNMRPNTAILAGIEFIASKNFRQAIVQICTVALLSLAVFGISYTYLNHIYPIYTIPHMLDGLRTYNALYFMKEGGDDFNLSIYAADKFVRHAWHIGPNFSNTAFYLFSALGAALILAALWLFTQKKLSRIEAVFLVLALCVLFTPVFTLYHLAEFAAVLPLILQQNRQDGFAWGGNVGLILTISLLVLSPLGGPRTNGVCCAILLLCATVLILRRKIGAGRATASA